MIKSITKLSDSHGAAQYETCECCGRKVRVVAVLDNDLVMGLQCAITAEVNALSAEDFARSQERLGVTTVAAMIGADGHSPMVKKAIASRLAA